MTKRVRGLLKHQLSRYRVRIEITSFVIQCENEIKMYKLISIV